MNNKNDNFADVIFGSVIFCAIGGLTVASIAFAWQDGYKWGIKESPAVVNIQGDQNITHTNGGTLSPFSGNGNRTK